MLSGPSFLHSLKYEMKLKKVIRSGVLETNSSSSHSVCISRSKDKAKPGDGVWDLDLREDGVLYIPCADIGFGRNLFKSNKCLMKLQYAYGLAYSCCPEKQYELTELVKRVTGAREVVIEWVEDYKKKVDAQGGLLKDLYVETPEIDHQSLDLYDEVFENEDTLKEFIFNPKSWLYGGSDETEDPSGFRGEWFTDEDEEENATLTIHFEDPIGDMDFDIHRILSSSPQDYERELSEDERLGGLYLNGEGKLDYLETMNIFSHTTPYINPMLLTDNEGKLVFAVYPLNKNACDSMMRIPRRNPNGLYTIDDIIQDTGLSLGGDGGFRVYPISITSEMFGKLC